jgi:transcription elongation factor
MLLVAMQIEVVGLGPAYNVCCKRFRASASRPASAASVPAPPNFANPAAVLAKAAAATPSFFLPESKVY